MRLSTPLLLIAVLYGVLMPCRVLALTLQLDYSSDAASMNFFGLRPAAKAALEAAAADINAVLNPSSLSAISPTGSPNVDLISGINGSTRLDADWDLVYTNPSTGTSVVVASPSIATDAVKIYVGLSSLGVGVLGSGAPAGVNLSLSASGNGTELPGALASLETASNAYMLRGSGPVINTISDSIDFGNGPVNYTLKTGVNLGQLSFNNDFDNNSVTDSLASLDNLWHYDHTTAVAVNKIDFYSVALHELLHALGIGNSDTWSSLVSGTTWLGPHAAVLNGGSGAGLISPDGSHITSGYMSTNIYSGLAQEAALDPSLSSGARKQLTAIDVAMLQDINYAVAVVPEPGSALLLICAGVWINCTMRRRQR